MTGTFGYLARSIPGAMHLFRKGLQEAAAVVVVIQRIRRTANLVETLRLLVVGEELVV
ncbi:hypothetical protein [Aquisphaera insulae]|uniref:hypothetical protein n=1 Tax=Aquisphaera insulae TaxID=2712864 RepID=UPI0013EDB3EE|nr:hypothetical protein [Aquisphaera insulae]